MSNVEAEDECVAVYGARVHNLKNINVKIPHNKLVVVTGLSGSGKSSLAFDTIYAEGQRRYIDTFSAYARGMLGNMERPDVDKITGLSPVISIEQKTVNKNPRSTIGTTTEIYDFLRLLYARIGEAYSYETGEKMVKYTVEKIMSLILEKYGLPGDARWEGVNTRQALEAELEKIRVDGVCLAPRVRDKTICTTGSTLAR